MRGLLLAAMLWGLPAAAAEPVQRYALLVGHNQGGGERATLRYAHTDAEAVREVLTGLGGVAPHAAQLLLDPDTQALEAAFDALQAKVEASGTERTEVVFYYSGHSDEEGLLLGAERFAYPALRARMDAIDAKVRLAILDSCASGAFIRSKGGQRVAPFLVDEASDVGGLAYITSSSEDEVAQEADRLGASYFTHYLTTGLRGAADVSGDGRVTLHEAYQFAKDETLQRTERTQLGPQHATYDFQLSGTGDLVLTDLTYTSASLVLDGPLEGRATVRTPEGALVAELQKPVDRAVELGLADGSYEVTLSGADGRYGVAPIELFAGESTVLGADALAWFDGESGVGRGHAAPPVAVLGDVASADEEATFRFEWVAGLPDPVPPPSDRFLVGAITGKARSVRGVAYGTVLVEVEDAVKGVEASFAVAQAGRLDHAAQVTFGVAIVNDGGRGLQLSPAANVNGGDLQGMQGSLVNVSESIQGLQLGLVNVGQRVRGSQIGLVNVGGEVDGVQLGLVNVADDVRGAPIGLLSFEKDGRHDLLLYASETDWVNAEIRLGGDVLYTHLGGGGSSGESVWLGAGLGAHAPFGDRVWLDLDLGVASYLPFDAPERATLAPRWVPRVRSTLGVQVLPQLAPFVGASLNAELPSDAAGRLAVVAPEGAWAAGEVRLWPGVFGGVQF